MEKREKTCLKRFYPKGWLREDVSSSQNKKLLQAQFMLPTLRNKTVLKQAH
jgi:hypothetical protein